MNTAQIIDDFRKRFNEDPSGLRISRSLAKQFLIDQGVIKDTRRGKSAPGCREGLAPPVVGQKYPIGNQN